MKSSPKFLMAVFALAVVVGSAVFFMAGGPESPVVTGNKSSGHSDSSPATAQKITAAGFQGSGNASADTSSADPAPAPVPATPATSNEQILTVIEDAAVSYSAEELPKIQPYLLHPDREVRAAALQGMITLGDAAAAPMLRAAAQLAPSTEEAAALKEAAAYVELPSGSLLNK